MKRIPGKPEWYLSDRQRHESYEGRRRLLPELPLVGRMHLLDALPHSLVAHTHPRIFEVHSVIHGVLTFWVEQRTYSVGPGMVFLTRPGETHGAVNEVLSPAEWYWIHIRFPGQTPLPGLSAADTRRIRRSLETTENRLFPSSRALADCFARLLAEHRAQGAMASLMARLTFQELLVCLLRDQSPAAPADPGPTLSPAIQRALAWIDDHLTEALSPMDVAGAAGLSPSSLRQHFAAEVGCSPSDHITRRRIERAKLLLKESKRSITEIAYSLGFSTSAYFTAVFKRLIGTNPREYRNRLFEPGNSPKSDACR